MNRNSQLFPRASGVLLHPTCLPGPHGIGDLGAAAYRLVDWLVAAGQSLWQVLPLGPTSYGNSPYQTLSALAGNPLLISLDELAGAGWLEPGDLASPPASSSERVDFGAVIPWKMGLLDRAWRRFQAQAAAADRAAFAAFRRQEEDWLREFALFAALKEEHGGRPWTAWPPALRDRAPEAIAMAAARLDDRIAAHAFRQWLFARQWSALREYAASREVRVLGDLPIFVAHDSCDVWARPRLFHLDAEGAPTVVAGVPPDYFSTTGQLWGNPLYDWNAMAREDYAWWVRRLRLALRQTDLVRIDHFRGFEAYWEVPASAETAVDGRWVKGPGLGFFESLRRHLGVLPIVAEDLGVITEAVEELRDAFAMPGMKVLQFAWDEPRNPFQPHNHAFNCVVYSGTHDNDPTNGWWAHECDEPTRDRVRDYVGHPVDEPNWALIRLGMLSVAHTFVMPMQDVFGLGREARMNRPGSESGNWDWRLPGWGLDPAHPARERLAHLTWLGRRRPDQRKSLYEDARERDERARRAADEAAPRTGD
ncbi:MAG TPA: 4-alpha-glucanotransferase [Candidatus Krumholzibacteria bacterium]|nr:4-alpha-glucanotransferase [Candidatus Krumholzibacteria bacterium]HPD72588.1 4-alpha-glucanotransferase [Candidatus Krumholzibacteria bacterium]HRY40480.1 4-alpha-glucanotransferase [Candidatus Krumholzibacteria bacterium]